MLLEAEWKFMDCLFSKPRSGTTHTVQVTPCKPTGAVW